MLIALLFVVVALAAAFVWWLEHKGRRDDVLRLEKANQGLVQEWAEARQRLDEIKEERDASRQQVARLEERAAAEKMAFEQMRSSLPDTFKTLASEVLEEKSRTFAQQNKVALEQNQASLGHLLDPLKSRLEDFQKKIEIAHLDQAKAGATLEQQVKTLTDSNIRISEQANNLALALKGSNKTQGNWGELVLESILESAGLRKGHEYETQESYVSEDRRRGQPDVVIHLPGEKHMIVDSKVSLLDYEAHCNAANDEARSAALTRHATSVRSHIKGLSEKNYQTLYGLNSLDFVIMFLPIEPALMLALSRDEKLWEWAWQRNVLMVSPSTLLFVLRTVSALWRQEQQQRNVEDIAKRGAALYNKLAGFVEDLQGVGKGLDQAQSRYTDALSKLSTGAGNVIRQAEMLKALGVKPAKHLPQGLVEIAQQEDFELEG